jgi:hypothetical protein
MKAVEPAGEEQNLEIAPIWNPNATANWSLLFTPGFGSLLQSLNWKVLSEPEKAAASKRWFYFTLALYAALPLLSFFIEEESIADAAARGIGFWYLIIWYFVSGRPQARYVKQRYANDYPRKPWSKAIGFGFLALVAYVLYSLVLGFAVGISTNSPQSTGIAGVL